MLFIVQAFWKTFVRKGYTMVVKFERVWDITQINRRQVLALLRLFEKSELQLQGIEWAMLPYFEFCLNLI
ncbi:hypothetical protein PRIP_13669 [Listeria riparia FSL S10-1204]|uniref:Uncharacterized protein n=1 Tax=Listeria riparia FSL S10-1204 TaxID=1265816 RepID=W7D2F4_9LIST|nr:hypothetical protein PRIP_13669 [Listeria riparia FSL S10-1204]